jgi:Fe-S-cluster-containing hydrogenase component 2
MIGLQLFTNSSIRETEMKRMKIDHSKCTGCLDCEMACSMKHYENEVNPKKSRVRVFLNEDEQQFFPVISGPPATAECTSKFNVVIAGQEYDDCTLCRVSCPSRTWFIEPDTGVALKCDFCGDPPDPNCVKVCESGALTLIEV